jgi:hypothetical protein
VAADTTVATTASAKVKVKSTLLRHHDDEDGPRADGILAKRLVGLEIARKIAFLLECGRQCMEFCI